MGSLPNYITEITLSLIGVLMGIEALLLLRFDRKGMLHYVGAAFCLLMGAFMVLFGFGLVALNVETAAALIRAAELVSILVMPLFLHGIVLLTCEGAGGRRRPWELLIYLPAVILLTGGLGESILFESFFIDERGVWNAVNRSEGWKPLVYSVYAVGCFLAGLGFLCSWAFRAGERAVRRLGRALNLATAGVFAAFCLSMANNLFYLYRYTPWSDFVGNLLLASSFYAWIVVYRKAIVAMTGGVADAASSGPTGGRGRRDRIRQSLVSLFGQPVLLLDRELRIEHCNQAGASIFGRECADLRGLPLAGLFAEPGAVETAMSGPATDRMLEARAVDGRLISLAMRSIHGEAGLVAGYLCQCSEAESSPAPAASPPSPEGIKLPYGEEISSREYEVLFLLAEGFDVDGIAERLFIAPSTVKSHIHHLYQKTGAHNRVELIKIVGAS